MTELDGGCRCGEIRYRVSDAPKFIVACHCRDCQQLSSSAFAIGMVVAEDGFTVTQGTPRDWAKQAASGKTTTAFTCPTCAGWTHTRPSAGAGYVIVRPTTLDDPSWVRPVAEIWTMSALPWARLSTLLSYPGQVDDPAPLAAAFAATHMVPGS